MKCCEAREGILEADPAVLIGGADGPLPQHLQTCSRCRVVAEAVVTDLRDLGLALGASVADPDLDAVLEYRTISSPVASGQESPKPKTTAHWWRWFPIPVAAAAAALALLGPGEPPVPGGVAASQETAQGLGLEVPEGTSIAVLETSNPDITVLWFF